MQKNYLRHFLSLSFIVSLFFFESSCSVINVQATAFNETNKVEELNNDGNYLVLNNGDKVKGKEIVWTFGALAKKRIKIDEQKFDSKDVKGFRLGNDYYTRFTDTYIRRIIHGPNVNVYQQYLRANTSITRVFYSQKGQDGPLVFLSSQKSIQQLVADCPTALSMATKSDKEIHNAVKNDNNYLNSIFDVYNSDCK